MTLLEKPSAIETFGVSKGYSFFILFFRMHDGSHKNAF